MRRALLVLVLLAVPALPPGSAADGPNLVANGGFEEGSPVASSIPGWTVHSYSVWSVARRVPGGHAGLWAAALVDESSLPLYLESAPIAVAPGQAMRAVAWLRDGSATTRFDVHFFDAGGASRYSIGNTIPATGSMLDKATQWRAVALDFVVPFGTTTARILFTTAWEGAAEVVLDDVSLRTVDGDGNLVSNGGFALKASAGDAPAMWQPAFSVSSHVVAGGYEGGTSLRLDPWSTAYSHPAPVAAGDTYRASIRTRQTAGESELMLLFLDAGGAWVHQPWTRNLEAGPAWLPLSVEACAPARAAAAVVRMWNPSTSASSWDAARLERSTGPCNLAANGGFEDGRPLVDELPFAWGKEDCLDANVYRATTNARSGSRALFVQDYSTGRACILRSTEVRAASGEAFAASAWVDVDVGSVSLRIAYLLGSTRVGGSAEATAGVSAGYAPLSVSGVVPAGADGVRLELVSSVPATSQATWDDVTLAPG